MPTLIAIEVDDDAWDLYLKMATSVPEIPQTEVLAKVFTEGICSWAKRAYEESLRRSHQECGGGP